MRNGILITAIVFLTSSSYADVWVFSGQSNMQKIGSAAQRSVGKVAQEQGRPYHPIYVAAPGKPIEGWLDPEHRDYDKLWKPLAEKIIEAKQAGQQFKGFVWYQGESNTKETAGQYQDQLAELIGRIRKLTGQQQLPAIVVQIGSATSYSGRDWAAATVREAQRRFARDDSNAAVVAAIDAEIGDYTVHLSSTGAQLVAERVALAADRLAYGNEKAHWGPQFRAAHFGNDRQQEVIVEFNGVDGKLALSDGWLAGFGASENTALPEKLSDLDDALMLGQLTDDYLYPVHGYTLDEKRLVLVFDKRLSADARLSYAAPRNAQYGPHRRWELEFTGLTDKSGHQAPAFVLVPIGKPRDSITLASTAIGDAADKGWRQIAVNCVGRFPPAVTSAKAEAGVDQAGWRQAYWNPAAAGLVPNLFDREGRVTQVGFQTGVWYMTPYFRELKNTDDALMASWCKNKLHGFNGLEPGATYDLAVYLLQGPPRQGDARPSHRKVRVFVLQMGAKQKRNDATVVAERTVDVPADGIFDGYQVAADSEESRGNVIILRGIPADKTGHIHLAVEVAEMKGDKLRWGATTLAGIQIRQP